MTLILGETGIIRRTFTLVVRRILVHHLPIKCMQLNVGNLTIHTAPASGLSCVVAAT